jgi:DDE superfamily endonuclease
MNLGNAAVFGVAEAAHPCENVKAKLVRRQGEVRLGLRAVRTMEVFTGGVGTTANVQGKATDTVEGGDGAEVAVVVPELVKADGTMAGDRDQGLRVRGLRPCAGAWHGKPSRAYSYHHFTRPECPPAEFAILGKKPRGRELTATGRDANHKLGQLRVRVEHAIAGVKRSRIVKDVFRNKKPGLSDASLEVACGLHNLRVNHRKRQ